MPTKTVTPVKDDSPILAADKFHVSAEYCDVPRAQVEQLVKAYKAAEAAEKRAKAKTQAARDIIINTMNGAEVLRVLETEQEIATYRVVEAAIIDTARLKLEQPEIAAKYQKSRTSRPFKLAV